MQRLLPALLLKETCPEQTLDIFCVGQLFGLLLRKEIHIAGMLAGYEIGSEAMEGDERSRPGRCGS